MWRDSTTSPQTADGAERRSRPAAPPDLARFREPFTGGVEALQEGDGRTAVARLSSFTFEPRAVEEYRLYFLSNAHQLNGDAAAARTTLARLWSKTPRLIYRDDVGFNLASLYARNGAWSAAAEVFGTLAARAETDAVAAAARAEYIEAKLAAGDVGGVLFAARNITIQNPTAPQAKAAASLVRQLSGVAAGSPVPMTIEERLERIDKLIEQGHAQSALADLELLSSTPLPPLVTARVQLARGTALQKAGRYAESDKTLTPLFSGPYQFAIPAIRRSATNNRILAAAIDPIVTKTIKERQRAGSVKVRVKGKKKLVTKPRYKTVFRTVKLVHLEKKQKKEEHERLYSERLKDLLQLPVANDIRSETLEMLIGIAEAKNQEPYLRTLVPQLIKLDPRKDPALQRFWNKAWAAYVAGDTKTAADLFTFIATTYTNPNTRRQSRYWLARTLERQGQKEAARTTFSDLAAAPYEDLYAKFSRSRLETPPAPRPVRPVVRDWQELAEAEMPPELRLAYELHILGLIRDARTELQRNAKPSNRRFADAILGQMAHAQGSWHVSARYLRSAFPELATPEQDNVPPYILKLYYPVRYHDEIFKRSKERSLDPYMVMALILQESAYNPRIKSPVGATGLMQLMPATGQELGRKVYGRFSVAQLTDPEVNINLGTLYIKQVIRMFNGNEELAIAGYNGGPYRIKKWRDANRRKPLDEFIESIPLSETRNYVKRVTMLRATYKKMYDKSS